MKPVAVALLAAAALSGCGDGHARVVTVTGRVVLSKPTGIADPTSYFIARDATGCHGTAVHPELTAGAQVSVQDPSGKVIALGHLSPGTWDGSTCTFTFSVPDVPSESFYGVNVAGTGAVQFSHADVVADNVEVDFS